MDPENKEQPATSYENTVSTGNIVGVLMSLLSQMEHDRQAREIRESEEREHDHQIEARRERTLVIALAAIIFFLSFGFVLVILKNKTILQQNTETTSSLHSLESAIDRNNQRVDERAREVLQALAAQQQVVRDSATSAHATEQLLEGTLVRPGTKRAVPLVDVPGQLWTIEQLLKKKHSTERPQPELRPRRLLHHRRLSLPRDWARPLP